MPWCIPEAIGVPGLYGQPPTWPGIDVLNGHTAWSSANSASTPLGLDDPRWQGHLSIGFPSITATPTELLRRIGGDIANVRRRHERGCSVPGSVRLGRRRPVPVPVVVGQGRRRQQPARRRDPCRLHPRRR